MSLPAPDPDALAYSQALKNRIANVIAAADGWIGFDRFMELALYAPGMGYYSGGARKFGAAGDFVTAPEISPVFSQTLAAQAKQIMALSAAQIIEVGAGSGRLAADLLLELELQNWLPESYAILDLSGELRQRQRETLMARAPHLLERVTWLDRLPEHFNGLVLANELLDAMPVHLVVWGSNDDPTEILERGVGFINDEFVWRDRPASNRVLERAITIATEHELPCGYLSEICLSATDWTAAWAGILGQGALLLIDYGFPRHEFYHPQRSSGTLMCHYRHHSHGEPFFLPGLQDITAHVDFTAIVEAGVEAKLEAKLDFLGYTSQAAFLLNCGITEILSRLPPEKAVPYLTQAQAVQKLISPAEMGELFKVIALGKGIKETLIGFTQGDRGATL
ncbi:MAG: SAM-dependent methyltransferase [Betaproteobacteria bacterium]